MLEPGVAIERNASAATAAWRLLTGDSAARSNCWLGGVSADTSGAVPTAPIAALTDES
ncbi:Uncharacterised protein [Mycobacteroides abscessus subsp. abscessus]|nr:Uncharacterised protein [Mycobacteroides abscessus subsp. abscessus]